MSVSFVLNPNFALAHYHLGQAYERMGERERARAAYERFFEIWVDADPDLPEVVEARARLVDRSWARKDEGGRSLIRH